MTRSVPSNLPESSKLGLESQALRSAFGFDRDDDAWLKQARAATAPGAPGLLGSFEIIEEIGRGSQGAVFKAVQPGTHRTIAVKRLAAGSLAGASARARMDREIKTLCSLSHPGIVTAFGADTIDGQTVLLMEWIDGVPIDQWASESDPLPSVRDKLVLFAKVCDAVSHAHQRGVLHRDLKPSNILVDTEGRPRVLDFGLAKILDDESSLASVSRTHDGFLGTPSYAAPEQVDASCGTVDTRADVYALGAVLYQLLTGALPVAPSSDMSTTLRAVIHDSPVRPSSRSQTLDSEIDAIVLKALAKEPASRYQSVDAFADDVRRHLGGRAVLAHPPSALYELRKLVNRHRMPVLIALAGIAGIGILAVVSSVLTLQLASREHDLQIAFGEAVAARDHAKQEARKSDANTEFLVRMFDTLGESVLAGEHRPERAMLTEARVRLESGELATQPELEVSLWRRLANTSFRLGIPAEAEYASARAIAIAQQHLKPDDEEMGRCILLSGLIAESRHETSKAESLYREALRVLRHALGPDHPETAHALNNLGCVLKDLYRFEESRACHNEALAIRLRALGPVNQYVAMTYRNLGTLARTEKKYDDAEMFYSKALETASQCNPRVDYQIAGILFHMGALAEKRKDFVRAEELLRQSIASHRALFGADTALQFKSLQGLASVLVRQKRLDDGIAAAKEVVDISDRILPLNHPNLAQAYATYGRYLMLAGRAGDAEPVLRRVIELLALSQTPSDKRITSARQDLEKCQALLKK